MKTIKTFWTAKDNHRITMSTDNDKFIAQIQAGYGGETFLSVGYSCPNYAYITDDMIEGLGVALDKKWKETEQKGLDEMLSALYELCVVANQKYNELDGL